MPVFSDVFIERLTVTETDLDSFNHVNNLQYILWTLKAATLHSRAVGWSSEKYRELGSGWIVRSHKITYKVAAQLGDEIEIETWIADLERHSSLRKYIIRRAADKRLCATAETRWVFVDFATMQLAPIPDTVREAFLPRNA